MLYEVITLTFGQAPNRGGFLRMTPAKQGVLVQNFNPFSPAALESTVGCLYETLIYFNMVDGSANPWLAEKWSWSKDLKTITFTIRSGVKYNDGSAMTVDDVLYSAMLGKDNKALDLSGLWAEGLQSVTVITSYSIHYTKLYDGCAKPWTMPRPVCENATPATALATAMPERASRSEPSR